MGRLFRTVISTTSTTRRAKLAIGKARQGRSPTRTSPLHIGRSAGMGGGEQAVGFGGAAHPPHHRAGDAQEDHQRQIANLEPEVQRPDHAFVQVNALCHRLAEQRIPQVKAGGEKQDGQGCAVGQLPVYSATLVQIIRSGADDTAARGCLICDMSFSAAICRSDLPKAGALGHIRAEISSECRP